VLAATQAIQVILVIQAIQGKPARLVLEATLEILAILVIQAIQV
jgi:hypothetical protein